MWKMPNVVEANHNQEKMIDQNYTDQFNTCVEKDNLDNRGEK